MALMPLESSDLLTGRLFCSDVLSLVIVPGIKEGQSSQGNTVIASPFIVCALRNEDHSLGQLTFCSRQYRSKLPRLGVSMQD